jgi:hypothetical protein
MSVVSNFTKKVLDKPESAQLIFRVAVLDKYLQSGTTVQRTDTVGRVKAASWSLDFGIAPDEQFIHTSVSLLVSRLPEAERDHWLAHLDDSRFSANFLKMTGGHSCVDDGGLRAWGEEEGLI